MYPYARHGKGRDAELKRQLVRAQIAACEAIWAVELVSAAPVSHSQKKGMRAAVTADVLAAYAATGYHGKSLV